ncbi:hypothetical protein HY745_09635 [Candidatus Desantisbacteria bacterium]|nr:hypothetical protein [Candidatus Desantisbacteria bacterium]
MQYGYSYSARYVGDNTPPGPVTDLKIVSDGDSHVTLSWHNPNDNDFKGIKIVRNLSGQPSSPDDGDKLFMGFDSTSFYKDSLSNGTEAYYGVFSYDEMENFSIITPVSIVMSDTTAPFKITTLSAEDDNSSGKVNLSWKGGSSADDIEHYNLYYKKLLSYQNISDAILLTQIKNDSTFTASGLDNGSAYYFAVTAVDEAGNENKEVETKIAIPTLDINPPSPVDFYIGPGTTPGSVKLDWDVYNESKEKDVILYRIYKSMEPFDFISSNLLFDSTKAGTKIYIFDNLNENNIYYFAVTAIDEMNNEYKDISGKSWGFNKIVFNSPIFEEVKIYKNGNYAYKGQYIGIVKNKETFDIYLYPKKNFLTLISSKNSNYYNISDINMQISNINIKKAIPAENIIFNKEAMLIDTKSLYAMPFVVDWDNDGNKDLLVGDANGFVKLYKSPNLNNSEEFLKVSGDNLHVTGNASPFVVDWDDDEKKDLLVGSSDGKVYLFKNTGTDISPEWSIPEILKDISGVEIDVGNDAVPFVVDWKYNNKFDNKKDLVIGGRDGKLTIYINKGTDYKPILEREGNFSLYVNGEKLSVNGFFIFSRWDDIETNDIILGEVNGMIYYGKNNGNNVFSYQIFAISDGGNIDIGNNAHPFWIDWDNDNVMDLIVGNAEGEVLFFKGKQFSNTSSGVHSSGTGPCIISNSLTCRSIYFLQKLKIIRDRYLFNNSAGKYIIEKYYQFTGEIYQ